MRLGLGRSREAVRWGSSLVFAGLGHAAVVVGFLLNIDFGNPRPALAAMVVDLAPIPVAVAAPPTEIPPGPPQVESRPQPKPEPVREQPFEPLPEVPAPTPPEFLVEKREIQEESELLAEELLADLTTATPTLTAPIDEKSVAPREGSSNDVSLTAERTWENTLLAHLERNKRYPGPAQRRRQEDVIYVRFAMDRHGKVLEYEIERSRGYTLLDQEVVALIERSSPLPPPPEEVAGDRVELVVPVEFFLRKTALN